MNKNQIVETFVVGTNQENVKHIYSRSMKILNELLEGGFTEQEVLFGIKHFIKHPPPKGFLSLAYLHYTLKELVEAKKAEHIRQSADRFQIDWNISSDSINTNKYKQKNRAGIKHTIQFKEE